MGFFSELALDVQELVCEGYTAEQIAEKLNLSVEQVEEYICQLEEADYDYDGQPDELTEWMDFDPDC